NCPRLLGDAQLARIQDQGQSGLKNRVDHQSQPRLVDDQMFRLGHRRWNRKVLASTAEDYYWQSGSPVQSGSESPPDAHRVEDDYRDSELQHFLCHLGSVVALARPSNSHYSKRPEHGVFWQRELARELETQSLTN